MFGIRVVRKKQGIEKLRAPKKGRAIVKVGFPRGVSKSSVIMHAIYNEFGTRGGRSGGGWGGPVPERPFLRNAMRSNNAKYQINLRKAAKSVLVTGTPVRAVLAKLGIMAQGDVQSEITTLRSPPNSPVTIKRKGSSNPLIDTGELRQAVTFKVEE